MKPAARRKARFLAVQAVYSWQISQNDIASIEQEMLLDVDVSKVDVDYFQDIIRGVGVKTDELDTLVRPHLDRKFDDVDQVEKAVLRVAAFELLFRKDVPYKVVINEAIELSKSFAADDSHRFVNGVLDKVVRAPNFPKDK